MPAFRFHQSLISTGEAYTVSPVFHASHRKTQTLISDTFTVYFEMTLDYLFVPCESEACACINVISSAPEVSVSILVFHVGIFFKYHKTTFPFQVSYYLCHTVFRRYRYQHMYMIRTRFCFKYFYLFIFTQLSQHPSYIFFYFSIYCLPSVLRRKYQMIFAIPLRM